MNRGINMNIGRFKITDICFIVLLVIFIGCICFYCYNGMLLKGIIIMI
jgi:hypothetical protein